MKIELDKKAITLEEIRQAKKLRKDYRNFDNDMLEILARKASGTNGKLIKVISMKVTKNNYKLTVFVKVILEIGDNFKTIYFDLLQAQSAQSRFEIDTYTKFID